MLIFGKQYTKNNTQKIGGVIKLFELFKDELGFNMVDFEVVDLNWRNYQNPLFGYLYIYFAALFKIRKCSSISFHGTANEFIYIAPVVVFFAKIFSKKVSLRKFAGNFDVVYENLNFIQKLMVKFSLRNSDVVFWETLNLVNKFKSYNSQTFWFPNVRPSGQYHREGVYNKRFVFVGQLKRTKGIYEILEAFGGDLDGASVDFYGPIEEPDFESICGKTENAKYCGILASNEILAKISKYDVLLLPSFHPGEGYPGVIIEAFSCGLPAIASDWGGIPEIIDSGNNGILIEPKNPVQLAEAIKSINVDNFYKLSLTAKESFEKFDSKKVTKDILKLMK